MKQNHRLQNARDYLKEHSIDALLCSDFYTIMYFTGFVSLSPHEREAFALITHDSIFLLTDARYQLEAHEFEKTGGHFCKLERGKGLTYWLDAAIKKEHLQSIGFESENITYSEISLFKERLPQLKWQPLHGMSQHIRMIKDREEVQAIKKACEKGDECLEKVIPNIVKEGVTEKEIALKIEFWIREQDCDLAFDPIVAIDEHAASAHYNTKRGAGVIKKGSILLIDFGVQYNYYNSDITRMFFFNTISKEAQHDYDILLHAQEEAILSLSAKQKLADIDIECRKELEKNGEPVFEHSLGHGIGLEVHENPKVSYVSTDLITPGTVFTIEPGIYKEGKYGMRIEDTVHINADHNVEILTQYPKQIAIL